MKYQKIVKDEYKEVLYKGILSSGLEVYYIPKPGYMNKYAFFATKYGALYNEFKDQDGNSYTMPKGIAHFLEHKVFEKKDGDAFQRFSKYGANVNAFTNFSSTVYTFSTVDHFYECLHELIDFVQTIELTEEGVEKEKDIIVQEIKMYDDDPEWKAYFTTLRNMYQVHPIREDIAGDEASVRSTTFDQLTTCYETFYSPENMTCVVIGDLDPDEVFETIEKSQNEAYTKRQMNVDIQLPEEPKEVGKTFEELSMQIEVPQFLIGIKDSNRYSEPFDQLKKSMALKFAYDCVYSDSSSYYQGLYSEGIVNASFSADYSYGLGFSFSVLGGESDDPELAIKKVSAQLEEMSKIGIKEKDFNRVKKKALGRFITSLNSMKAFANGYVSFRMKGLDLFDYMKAIESIDYAYANDTFKQHLSSDDRTITIVR